MRKITLFAACALLSACGGSEPSAPAVDPGAKAGPASFEKYCNAPELPKALRQTVLVIDENEIHPNPAPGKLAPENRSWTMWIGGLLGKGGDPKSSAFTPRERVTIVVAPRSGSEPRTVFTGCLPGFSPEEVQAIVKRQGGVGSASSSFFGSGPVQTAAKDAERFRSLLGAALAHLGDAEPAAKAGGRGDSFETSSLLASLRQKSLVDLDEGLPRVVVYSDVGRLSADASDIPDARRAGFALARTTPIDLKRAQVFFAGVQPSEQSDRVKAFIDAYMLGSEGHLRGFGTGDIGLHEPAPQTVRVYSGMIRYGAEDVPMRLRLATTNDGRIIDSWIAVRRDVETATPFEGEIVSDGRDGEIGRNDGKGLGQLWSLNPDPAPEFTANMAFGGLRGLELHVRPDGTLDGKIADPMVDRINGNSKPYIEFKLHLDEKSRF